MLIIYGKCKFVTTPDMILKIYATCTKANDIPNDIAKAQDVDIERMTDLTWYFNDDIKQLQPTDRFEKNTLLVIDMKKVGTGAKRRKTAR